jgi:hypothetical protein
MVNNTIMYQWGFQLKVCFILLHIIMVQTREWFSRSNTGEIYGTNRAPAPRYRDRSDVVSNRGAGRTQHVQPFKDTGLLS